MIRSHYKNSNFPHFIYECVKYSSGLLGFWLEELIKGNSINKPADLNPPIVETIAGRVEEHNVVFDDYWKECFSERQEGVSPFHTDCLVMLEDLDLIIRMDNGTLGFVNPFLLLHPSVVRYLKPQVKVFLSMLVPAFTKPTWDGITKRKALEIMIVAALGLRQLYSNSATFSSVLKIMCGTVNYSNHRHDVLSSTVRPRPTFKEVDTSPPPPPPPPPKIFSRDSFLVHLNRAA